MWFWFLKKRYGLKKKRKDMVFFELELIIENKLNDSQRGNMARRGKLELGINIYTLLYIK